MLHYYTFEYGVVGKSEAYHVYCSRDRLIGLVVRTQKRDGAWEDGHSRFFVWDEGLGQAEYETEQEARRGGRLVPVHLPAPRPAPSLQPK